MYVWSRINIYKEEEEEKERKTKIKATSIYKEMDVIMLFKYY